MSYLLLDDLREVNEYLWDLKNQNEWKRNTTTRNTNYLDDLQLVIDKINRLIKEGER